MERKNSKSVFGSVLFNNLGTCSSRERKTWKGLGIPRVMSPNTPRPCVLDGASACEPKSVEHKTYSLEGEEDDEHDEELMPKRRRSGVIHPHF
jgi:hypothetical protein